MDALQPLRTKVDEHERELAQLREKVEVMEHQIAQLLNKNANSNNPNNPNQPELPPLIEKKKFPTPTYAEACAMMKKYSRDGAPYHCYDFCLTAVYNLIIITFLTFYFN